MRLAKILMAAAAVSMSAAPALAAPANPAASLSVAKSVRAGTPAGKKNNVVAAGVIVALLAAAAVAVGVVVVADDDGGDSDEHLRPAQPVTLNPTDRSTPASSPYRRHEMVAVSRTGTPLSGQEPQASIQIGAIDNSLSWPWKHPDAVSAIPSSTRII